MVSDKSNHRNFQKELDQQLKEELADKLLSTERLSVADRQEIYRLLTGKKIFSVKRGRPTKKVRDYRITLNYLTMVLGDPKKAHIFRDRLVKKYGLSDKVNTFYSVLDRGRDTIQLRAEVWLDKLKNDDSLNMSEEEKEIKKLYFEKHLKMLDDFHEQNKHLTKLVTK